MIALQLEPPGRKRRRFFLHSCFEFDDLVGVAVAPCNITLCVSPQPAADASISGPVASTLQGSNKCPRLHVLVGLELEFQNGRMMRQGNGELCEVLNQLGFVYALKLKFVFNTITPTVEVIHPWGELFERGR